MRKAALPEIEVQQIIKKLAYGLSDVYDKNIIHRDLNINNVVIHIPDLEPSQEELQDPGAYLKKLGRERKTRLKDLTKIKFEVKIIDYGLSCIL